jgi:hypothetical protein
MVTTFKCGGFMLGLAINHCMFDGVGALQFALLDNRLFIQRFNPGRI